MLSPVLAATEHYIRNLEDLVQKHFHIKPFCRGTSLHQDPTKEYVANTESTF